YVEAVAPLMLPQVAGRPTMLLRCPEGRDKACFFQKHPSRAEHESVESVRVPGAKGVETYLTVRDAPGLVSLVQMGALEFPVSGARADRPRLPDRVVFDLDPSPGSPWPAVIETARRLRQRLEALDLESFLKTTGGKGLHVVVPIRRGPDWELVRGF